MPLDYVGIKTFVTSKSVSGKLSVPFSIFFLSHIFSNFSLDFIAIFVIIVVFYFYLFESLEC